MVPVDLFHRWVLDILEGLQRPESKRATRTDGLGLEQPDPGLGQRVVVGVTDAADGRGNALQDKGFREGDRGLLAVVDQPFAHRVAVVIAAPQCHLQRGRDHRGVLGLGYLPAHDGPRETVDHQRHVHAP